METLGSENNYIARPPRAERKASRVGGRLDSPCLLFIGTEITTPKSRFLSSSNIAASPERPLRVSAHQPHLKFQHPLDRHLISSSKVAGNTLRAPVSGTHTTACTAPSGSCTAAATNATPAAYRASKVKKLSLKREVLIPHRI